MIIPGLKEEINRRGISRLCHFTNSRSLLHIIQREDGILANSFLKSEEEKGILLKNDRLRLDGMDDHISCSIEYPNTWYLNKIKERDPNFTTWVILFIDPLIMDNENSLFSHRNAASEMGGNLKNGLEGFRGMFNKTVQGQFQITRTPKMLDCCTTDGQAEVMIYKNIPLKNISGICVPNINQAKLEWLKISHLPFVRENIRHIKWVVAPDLFIGNWSRMIKNGLRPKETIISESELET